MAKDYKHRIIPKKKAAITRTVPRWQWLMIGALILGFIIFLVYLRITSPDEKVYVDHKGQASENDQKSAQNAPQKPSSTKTAEPAKPKAPHFEFYTVLPDKEVVVPDYELKTRIREERIGKAKNAQYVMQVGSFQTFKEADQLRAKLALMGIASKVDKAKVGGATTHRVKLGPFTQMKSVNDIRLRLKTMGANVIVTEIAATKPVVQTPQKQH